MTAQELRNLLLKYENNTATEQEKALLESWYTHHSEEHLPPYTLDERLKDAEAIRAHLKQNSALKKSRSLPLRLSAAACVLALLCFGSYYFIKVKKQSSAPIALVNMHDVPPGQNKATLTLANGKKIYISGSKKGIIYNRGAFQISQNKNGNIAYVVNPTAAGNPQTYNKLSTPRGGQLSITLPDGTVAYLDAMSSITFPIAFRSGERRVSVTGQVYFDVRHNAAKPFRVDVKGQTIQDIGTSFNINAYDDEPALKTTLVSGAIKIVKKASSATLKPGQQAITSANDNTIQLQQADTEEVTAWKSGNFMFNNEKLESIMRKIARWYDVDVVNPQDQNLNIEYWGSITRYENVSKVLKMLEITGDVKFRIEDRKIIIEKK